jgi:hypothetical protein
LDFSFFFVVGHLLEGWSFELEGEKRALQV